LITLLIGASVSDAICALPGSCDRACCQHPSEGSAPVDDSAPCCQLPDAQLTRAHVDLRLPSQVCTPHTPVPISARLRIAAAEIDQKRLEAPPPPLHLVFSSLLL
jgi:hypothetical protein